MLLDNRLRCGFRPYLVSGGGLTARRQDLLFSCLAPLHKRGM
jgi:hypothetical protein